MKLRADESLNVSTAYTLPGSMHNSFVEWSHHALPLGNQNKLKECFTEYKTSESKPQNANYVVYFDSAFSKSHASPCKNTSKGVRSRLICCGWTDVEYSLNTLKLVGKHFYSWCSSSKPHLLLPSDVWVIKSTKSLIWMHRRSIIRINWAFRVPRFHSVSIHGKQKSS